MVGYGGFYGIQRENIIVDRWVCLKMGHTVNMASSRENSPKHPWGVSDKVLTLTWIGFAVPD